MKIYILKEKKKQLYIYRARGSCVYKPMESLNVKSDVMQNELHFLLFPFRDTSLYEMQSVLYLMEKLRTRNFLYVNVIYKIIASVCDRKKEKVGRCLTHRSRPSQMWKRLFDDASSENCAWLDRTLKFIFNIAVHV